MPRRYLTAIDLNKNELQNARLQNLASAPSSPVVGQLYLDTTASPPRLYYWTGSAWANHASDSDLLAGQNGAYYRGRANHTGTQAAATISDFDTQVRTSRLDQMAAPTAAVSMNSQRITGLGAPVSGGDAVTKNYADGLQAGLDAKQSVRAASTANVAVTYNATGGTSTRGQITAAPNTLDGVTLAAGNRILLKNQTTGAQNGIYVVTTVGTGANGVWDRATDFDEDAEVTPNSFVFVEEGTTNADTGWTLTNNAPITIGGGSGTALTWAQFSGGGDIQAGAGLTKTGNTLDVGQGTGISVAADSVAIDPAVVVRKYAANVGDGSLLAYVLTHNLNTQDIQVMLRENASPFAYMEADYEATTVNTATIRFATAPTANQYRAVIFG